MRKLTVVASLPTLMKYAKELGDAKKSGNMSRIEEAQKQHDEYHALCIKADRIITGFTHGDMY